MDNQVWKELIGRLYDGFHNTTEVMAVIGYTRDPMAEGGVDIVESISYYTSHDESEVLGNFRAIVKGMAKYPIYRAEGSRFLVVHNHPAGTAEPSESDIKLTQRFSVACRMLGAKMMGSYIYVDNDNIHLIGTKDEEFGTSQIRMSNQFPDNGEISMRRLISERMFAEVLSDVNSTQLYGHRLNEALVDAELLAQGVEPFGIIELSDENDIKGVYELNKLQPNNENIVRLPLKYRCGMATLFRRDNPRFVVYDKRVDVERDELGLAEDAKTLIQSMGLVGYPVTFYINN